MSSQNIVYSTRRFFNLDADTCENCRDSSLQICQCIRHLFRRAFHLSTLLTLYLPQFSIPAVHLVSVCPKWVRSIAMLDVRVHLCFPPFCLGVFRPVIPRLPQRGKPFHPGEFKPPKSKGSHGFNHLKPSRSRDHRWKMTDPQAYRIHLNYMSQAQILNCRMPLQQ